MKSDHKKAVGTAQHWLVSPGTLDPRVTNICACYLELVETGTNEKPALLSFKEFIAHHELASAVGTSKTVFHVVFPRGSMLERSMEQDEEGEQRLVMRVLFPSRGEPEAMSAAYETWRTHIFAKLRPGQIALVSLQCQPMYSSPSEEVLGNGESQG